MMLVLVPMLLATAVLAFDGPLHVFSELGLSEATVQQSFFSISGDDVLGVCNPNLLDEAQRKFNDDLGINVDLTWRNASSLSYFVNKLISSSVQGLVTACNARRDYAGVLLATYPFCVNRFFLFQQGGTDFNNVVTYVHLFKHLEFLCSTGFDTYQFNLPCIVQVSTRNDQYNACYNTFQKTITDYPNTLCDASQTLVLCLRSVFTTVCGAETAWVECEMERLGYAYDCNGLTC